MIILAIDPSSSITGFALLDEAEKLLDAGTLRPNKRTDASEFRIAAMCDDLETILIATNPDIVVIEWTSGKVGRRRHKGHGAGLAIYGLAIGAIWRTATAWAARRKPVGQVVTVLENDWTAWKSKEERSKLIAREYPKIDFSKDTGGDIADAIGLGVWFARRFKSGLILALKQ